MRPTQRSVVYFYLFFFYKFYFNKDNTYNTNINIHTYSTNWYYTSTILTIFTIITLLTNNKILMLLHPIIPPPQKKKKKKHLQYVFDSINAKPKRRASFLINTLINNLECCKI